ncbi:hypothetical protein M501DRAFT_925158 [Patellaria atrata CBS 101060]|uniref:Calcineurin-like phosphoesterase domain-containing protein n=1 Tax=Patellaria atrata CBS 101060 TaxID=1346257 RepID=A0A9P4SJC8_9PEZI|nr:hypothetical protein M501DRAFT_925158 [Patellaria atrata CBS 101060]
MIERSRNIVISLVFFVSVSHTAQPSAPAPIAAPLRELPWGQLNFLHTTDTHGWHGGHLQEPSFSADWGDYISFAKHLRDRADLDGSDILLIDTGDRVEGNGLYDASEPKGKYTFDIFKEQTIDVICSGNHELYKRNSSENEFNKTVPFFKGNYLSSNIDIYSPVSGVLEPLAPRFKKFTTKNQGIRILAFGFLFDFKGNANNTVVHTVEETVNEKWFKEAILDRDVDLIVVIGHVAIRSKEYDLLYQTIRTVHWDTPIQFFGGHTHIRDYKIYDSKSVAIESGRYMETIGFMAINGLHTPKNDASNAAAELNFARRYIDNNLYSLRYHSRKNESTFTTEHGLQVSRTITKARKALELDRTHGCAPQDFWVNRVPYPSNNSIFTLLENGILPSQLSTATRAAEGHKGLVITNTGALRFDIFRGSFTKDSTFLVSPFTSGFRYIKDVPVQSAKRILELLNNEGPVLSRLPHANDLRSRQLGLPSQMDGLPTFSRSEADNFEHIRGDSQAVLEDDQDLTPGYTTKDDAGTDGDDTIHSSIAFYDIPNCIQAGIGFELTPDGWGSTFSASVYNDEPDVVDVIYNEFIERYILLALEYLGENYEENDTEAYLHGKTLTDIITDWVSVNWPPDDNGSCP